ncbi:phosphoribosylamine--glycine ligase [Erysipelothrix aquatica]|uniref:phosphoribosylamine--glycine ligase n=1 Tax=Erysipelothrix aquatica TaxID=2683714 RepID=UPI001357ABC7|nr:phosphoribosylamine--glycine ligase [Erysipelothrix aquatica]
MKILVIGSGGREHALYWKLAQSPKVTSIVCAPGNGGTDNNVDIASDDIQGLLNYAIEHKIDLTVVGPEDPLCLGIVDTFEEHGLAIFGPNKHAAQLEGSKDFSKSFMVRHNIPTAEYNAYTHHYDALNAISSMKFPLVIKADGLCKGKGVIICETHEEAKNTLYEIYVNKQFGSEGNKVILETFLDGYETSLLCFVSNNRIFPMETARDYKKIGEGDTGENTGGVGCYSPAPAFSNKVQANIDKILTSIEVGLSNDDFDFNGVLYVGLMIVEDTPYVLEFNTRFGDPETEVLLPRLQSDLVDIMMHVENDTLQQSHLQWDPRTCITTIVVSKGYPRGFDKNISVVLEDNGLVFHNGTQRTGSKVVSVGGRVLSFVEIGDNLVEMNAKLNNRIEKLEFENKAYRRDIGLI